MVRQKLAQGRAQLREQHERGSPGIQVCTHLTDLIDHVLLDLYQDALEATGSGIESLIALSALGGYGRRDVAPYSDVDLMVLHRRGAEGEIGPFARLLTQEIVDAGFQLGFSLRTPSQACSLAMGDATIFTSLVEARFLTGSSPLFAKFTRSFRRAAQRRSSALIGRIEASRRDERRQYGETVYLLEPNVKRSRGGLRDLQLLRWIAFARYGECEPEGLVRSGLLSKDDQSKMRIAHEFLLRLRNELHFRAGKAQDLLDKEEQLRIAELFGYQGDSQMLPVERFLRDYIEHTNDVRYGVVHFLAGAKTRLTLTSVMRQVFSHQVEGDFRVTLADIGATRRGLEKVCTDLAEVMRLMDLANRYGIRIDHRTWMAIRESMIHRHDIGVSAEATDRFLSFISQPGQLGGLLRRLHELRVLEKMIPPMAHARGLMQFNEYHKYTIDEHSIRTVGQATGFLDDHGLLGDAYRGIKEKRVLHLALLLHDLGKGFAEDHSDVGRRLAVETAEHLGLGKRETETLRFLVHKHLLMSHMALRRDINDDGAVVQFAVEVGSPERLQMLFVLTCADLAAVGPGVLTNWKRDLLTRLYERTRQHLVGDVASTASAVWIQTRRKEIRDLVPVETDATWWDAQVEVLPRSYLEEAMPDQIIRELNRLKELAHDDAFAHGRYLPERNAVEYTVGTYEQITPGIFHKLTGALSSKGLQILSAEIHTLAHDMVLDRFYVHDMDYAGEPPAERAQQVVDSLVSALKEASGKPPTFRRVWAAESKRTSAAAPRLATQARVDNNTSERYTILDIFAHDRMGLLYTIAHAMFQMGLSVRVAKIGTYLDQVVDVFYVTDSQGKKIVEEARVTEMRQRITDAIEAFTDSSDIAPP
ncbi:MAG: [protein-PII] uridylyltransferase [Pirellulaceae bacterium]